MAHTVSRCTALLASLLLVINPLQTAWPAVAQEQKTASTEPPQAPADRDVLSEDEMEVLVSRIALYPDELVAAISAASLFPLQIVEAQRFLEARKTTTSLKPKDTWDGSVISLLNYPQIIKMMSEDLDWTQSLGDALTNQQKDVLTAIQQLRDEAVAKNIIKTDDKVTVVNEGDNVVIRSVDPEKVYIPQYPPEMLYQPGYEAQPISYYQDSYPSYYYPGAAFFAAAVTGVAWASIVDWNRGGVWGGNWNGGNVDIDCNNCLNNRNFNGKMNFNDVDWKNVDRSKIRMDRSQLSQINRTSMMNSLQANGNNNLRNRASDAQRQRASTLPARAGRASDIRKSTAQGLKDRAGNRDGARPSTRPAGDRARPGSGANANRNGAGRPSNVQRQRPQTQPKLGARADNRPRAPSGLGNMSSGRRQMDASRRGGQSMYGGRGGGGYIGGGYRGGGHMSRGGGGYRGGGGGHRPRGGGGRGGRR